MVYAFAVRIALAAATIIACASPLGADAAAPMSQRAASGEPAPSLVGKTILLAVRTKTSACHSGDVPDLCCSPGAYYSKLTKKVICSDTFRTSAVRYVPESVKYAVEREYGMKAKSYGSKVEIDHIVSLELGGSNDSANLFPEPASGVFNYHVKDNLENKLHDLVCDGRLKLAAVRKGIASDWKKLYAKVLKP